MHTQELVSLTSTWPCAKSSAPPGWLHSGRGELDGGGVTHSHAQSAPLEAQPLSPRVDTTSGGRRGGVNSQIPMLGMWSAVLLPQNSSAEMTMWKDRLAQQVREPGAVKWRGLVRK